MRGRPALGGLATAEVRRVNASIHSLAMEGGGASGHGQSAAREETGRTLLPPAGAEKYHAMANDEGTGNREQGDGRSVWAREPARVLCTLAEYRMRAPLGPSDTADMADMADGSSEEQSTYSVHGTQ